MDMPPVSWEDFVAGLLIAAAILLLIGFILEGQ